MSDHIPAHDELAATFQDAAVVEAYKYRAPYPPRPHADADGTVQVSVAAEMVWGRPTAA